jgi:hypothetical protein
MVEMGAMVAVLLLRHDELEVEFASIKQKMRIWLRFARNSARRRRFLVRTAAESTLRGKNSIGEAQPIHQKTA